MNIFKTIINRSKSKITTQDPIAQSTVLLTASTIQLFPETIDFSDGELRENDGFFSMNLSKAWSQAEAQNTANDEWVDFMIWSIYGVLHRRCSQLFKVGVYTINVNELDYHEINAKYVQNLLVAGIPIETTSK